ncbi:hypothetical protein K7X08_000007 [Anisodus acutangulus]|uniref:Uncharacterized protein n=1 Tax=Anisodus acutangulus TaxID=402998 RepID=A0A9Q1R2U2_9SOLA|nr:hypothetical protein K7X08_000007 [Anisodus acutangulus]
MLRGKIWVTPQLNLVHLLVNVDDDSVCWTDSEEKTEVVGEETEVAKSVEEEIVNAFVHMWDMGGEILVETEVVQDTEPSVCEKECSPTVDALVLMEHVEHPILCVAEGAPMEQVVQPVQSVTVVTE